MIYFGRSGAAVSWPSAKPQSPLFGAAGDTMSSL